jgi:hypothetical protein
VTDAHADRRDLVLASVAARHPDADPALAPLGAHVEAGEGADGPVLEIGHEAADVLLAGAQVEHGIDHPLARPMIGVLPAAPCDMNRKAHRLQQVGRLGTGAGGVERRMLEQPDQLAGPTGADVGHPRFHGRQGFVIGNEPVGDSPFRPRHCGKIGICRGRCKGLSRRALPLLGLFGIPRPVEIRRGRGGIGRRASLRC